MDAKSSAGVPLSSPAAAQRCAEGAGLDSGAPAAAQSAMPSIAPLPPADRRSLSTNAAAPAAPQLQSRISTSLTDVTHAWPCFLLKSHQFVENVDGAAQVDKAALVGNWFDDILGGFVGLELPN
jgi:hypothetical protein